VELDRRRYDDLAGGGHVEHAAVDRKTPDRTGGRRSTAGTGSSWGRWVEGRRSARSRAAPRGSTRCRPTRRWPPWRPRREALCRRRWRAARRARRQLGAATVGAARAQSSHRRGAASRARAVTTGDRQKTCGPGVPARETP
jgi:hypothetical protein